jgi:ABC-type amino acid transport substrate-binding protein
MTFLPWMKFDLTWIAEHFLELVRDQYWLSVLILWAIAIIVFSYIGTVVATGVKLARSVLTHLRTWYILLPAVIGCAALLAISMATAAYLRGSRLPVPSLSDLKVVFGDDELLRWDVPPGSADLMFQVQWSTDARFPAALSRNVIVNDTIFPLDATRNETIYWRVRALELQGGVPHRFGSWSRPVKIEQYANVLEKIRRTRRLTVAMENEFGRSMFRWYEPEVDDRRHTEILDQAVSFRGVDIELAYAIADEACARLLEGQLEDGKVMTCMSSRARPASTRGPDQAICKEKTCVRVEVRIAALPWSDILRSVGEGRFDTAISSITYVPEREDHYNILFSTRSYDQTSYGIVSKRDGSWPADKRRFTQAATSLKGLRVGVQPETTGAACVRYLLQTLEKAGDKDSFRVVEQSRDLVALHLLVRGKSPFDLMVKDGTTAEGWKALHGDGILVEHTPPDFFGPDAPPACRGQQYRVAVRAGEFGLQELIDRVLARTDWLDRIKAEAAEQYASYLRVFKSKSFETSQKN